MTENIKDTETIEQEYREMLNEVYGEIKICGYIYSAAEAFADVDPIAFECGLADYMSELDELDDDDDDDE